MPKNTETRQRILRFIRSREAAGCSPSVREIGRAVGLSSAASVHGYLQRMERDGLLTHEPYMPYALPKEKAAAEGEPLRIRCDFELPPDAQVQTVIALLTDREGRPLGSSRARNVVRL